MPHAADGLAAVAAACAGDGQRGSHLQGVRDHLAPTQPFTPALVHSRSLCES